MDSTAIISLISVAAALVLALRALRSHQLSFERRAGMAIAWIVIIMVLAFILDRFTG